MNRTKKTKKKRGGVFAALAAVLVIFAVGVASGKAFERLSELPDYGMTVSAEKSEGAVTAEIPEDRFLILVNSKNKIPENYEPELTELSNGQRVDSGIYPELQRMFDDMRAEGIYPVVGEGYRTRSEQQRMLDDKIRAFEKEGYSEKRARAMAEEWVAVPGTSEHELGLAVDINADKDNSSNEDVYEWLYENACRYGFILRYPIGKTLVTGIDYEPWHYRYVGTDYAEEIAESGLCLEEWLEKNPAE